MVMVHQIEELSIIVILTTTLTFYKWWVTTSRDGRYNWDDTENPYLDIHSATLYEPVDHSTENSLRLSPNAALTLLKIRLRNDLQNFKDGSS